MRDCSTVKSGGKDCCSATNATKNPNRQSIYTVLMDNNNYCTPQ